MINRGAFSIADFARLVRVSRQTLIHYDRIGLLPPMSRGGNNYRFYSPVQVAGVNLIRTFQELGMPLSRIKQLTKHRTPEMISELLEGQIKCVDEHIDKWVRSRKLLLTLCDTVKSALDVDESEISIRHMPTQAIVLGGLNDYSRGKNDFDALFDFYRDCNKKYPGLDLNYPAWGMFSQERIISGDWRWPDRFYFLNPDGLDKRPAALYAIGYKRGGYGQSEGIYERMLEYIGANGFEVCGPAYEEYPHNEICYNDDKDYLMRVMITVRER